MAASAHGYEGRDGCGDDHGGKRRTNHDRGENGALAVVDVVRGRSCLAVETEPHVREGDREQHAGESAKCGRGDGVPGRELIVTSSRVQVHGYGVLTPVAIAKDRSR